MQILVELFAFKGRLKGQEHDFLKLL